jgi:L-asparagine transporter-like permease
MSYDKNKRVKISIVAFFLLFVMYIVSNVIITFAFSEEFRFPLEKFRTIIFLTVGVFIILWIFISNIKDKHESVEEMKYKNDKANKAKLLIACLAVHTAITMILVSFLIIIDRMDYFNIIVTLYVFLGWILVFPIAWKFFSKRLEL